MGALKLVGPTLKFGATGSSVILNNVVGPVLTGASKIVANKYTMQALQKTSKVIDNSLEKLGVPDFSLWKFSSARDYSGSKSVMPSIRSAIEGALSNIMSGGKFGPQASSELKKIEGITNCTPSYNKLIISFNLQITNFEKICSFIKSIDFRNLIIMPI
jgi:hypothetical protein